MVAWDGGDEIVLVYQSRKRASLFIIAGAAGISPSQSATQLLLWSDWPSSAMSVLLFNNLRVTMCHVPTCESPPTTYNSTTGASIRTCANEPATRATMALLQVFVSQFSTL